MKIIQTPPRFYPYIGGVENYVYYLSKELAKLGHKVKIICANEPAIGDSIIDNIEVKRLKYIGKVANTNITLDLPKTVLTEDFDLIHTHLPTPWSADISAIISLFKNKPLFLTYHNDIPGIGINKFIANFYNFTALKFLLKRAHRIFITHKNYLKTSPFLKQFLNKIVVTPPGIDLEKFRPLNLPKKDDNIIFFLSKLDKFHLYKGLEYLLLSIKKVIPNLSLKLYIGGEGELSDYYKKFVKENDLENAVIFLGFLKEEELLKYYNLCDVFVLPSISAVQEGFGLVALEAMACKKPVIVTELIGVAEDIRQENAGIVVKPKNVDELSDALKLLFSNKKEMESRGENAYGLVNAKYTWQKNAEITEREYLKAIR